jgi:hypothetical protein
MASVVIAGNTSGSVTLDAPAVAGTTVLTLPAVTGTFITTTSGVAPGTAGNVLTSNGTSWTSAAAAAFDAGTRLGFQQTTAPTGWTKDTTAAINDSMLRLVTGAASSGGSTAFSTWSAATSTSAFTLTTSEIPSHTHTCNSRGLTGGGSNFAECPSTTQTISTNATGGGGGHSHGLTRNLKYYDFIIASKN